MTRNPVLIVVPCYRVLGADGKLVGCSAGLATKERLLNIEPTTGPPQLDVAP
ncbi:MAG: MGMT family protein [Pseudonocardiaceae bacterium]